jgi:hypothetical protein
LSGKISTRFMRTAMATAVGICLGALGLALLVPAGRTWLTDTLIRSGTLAARIDFWQIALNMIAWQPLLGTGLGSYGVFHGLWRGPGMRESQWAHNLVLEWTVAAGLIGLLLGVWLIAGLLRRAWQRGLLHDSSLAPAWACLTALVAPCLLDFVYGVPEIAGLGALCLGLIAARSPAAGHTRQQPEMMRAAAAIAIMGLWAQLALRPTMARANTEMARSLVSAKTVDVTGLMRAQELLVSATRWWPASADARRLLAHVQLSCGEWTAALESAHRAVGCNPWQSSLYMMLAECQLACQQPAEAFASAEKGLALHPASMPRHEEFLAIADQVLQASQSGEATATETLRLRVRAVQHDLEAIRPREESLLAPPLPEAGPGARAAEVPSVF